jgi:hypothetical protein
LFQLLDVDLERGDYAEAQAILRVLTSIAMGANPSLHKRHSDFALIAGDVRSCLLHSLLHLGGLWKAEMNGEKKARFLLVEWDVTPDGSDGVTPMDELSRWMWEQSLLLLGTIVRSMETSVARGLLMGKPQV